MGGDRSRRHSSARPSAHDYIYGRRVDFSEKMIRKLTIDGLEAEGILGRLKEREEKRAKEEEEEEEEGKSN